MFSELGRSLKPFPRLYHKDIRLLDPHQKTARFFADGTLWSGA